MSGEKAVTLLGTCRAVRDQLDVLLLAAQHIDRSPPRTCLPLCSLAWRRYIARCYSDWKKTRWRSRLLPCPKDAQPLLRPLTCEDS